MREICKKCLFLLCLLGLLVFFVGACARGSSRIQSTSEVQYERMPFDVSVSSGGVAVQDFNQQRVFRFPIPFEQVVSLKQQVSDKLYQPFRAKRIQSGAVDLSFSRGGLLVLDLDQEVASDLLRLRAGDLLVAVDGGDLAESHDSAQLGHARGRLLDDDQLASPVTNYGYLAFETLLESLIRNGQVGLTLERGKQTLLFYYYTDLQK